MATAMATPNHVDVRLSRAHCGDLREHLATTKGATAATSSKPWYRFSAPSIVARDLIEVKERSTQEQHRREHEVAEKDRHALGLVAHSAQQEDEHRPREEVDDHQRCERPDGVDVVGSCELQRPTESGPQAKVFGETNKTFDFGIGRRSVR